MHGYKVDHVVTEVEGLHSGPHVEHVRRKRLTG